MQDVVTIKVRPMVILERGDLLHLGRVEKLHLQAAVHFLIGVVVIMLSIIYQFNKLNVGFVFLDV